MAYVTASELRALLPDEYRDAALADRGQRPEPGLLAAVIDQACGEVNALIEGRVRLPLSEPFPRRIKIAAAYFALKIFYVRRGVDMPKALADEIAEMRRDLGKIGAGDLRILAPAEPTAAAVGAGGSIVVRPSVTGTGGLIGAVLFLLCASARPASGLDARTFEFNAPTNPLIESADYVEWSQAESVRLRYRLPAADAAREARWEIADATNLWLNMAPARSGAVWTWNPAPTQTCLPEGRYDGRVAVYERSGTNLVFHRVLAFQDIRVHPARDPANLVFASPLDNLDERDPVAAAALAAMPTSSWNEAHGWGDHAAAGYLTNETDAVALAAVQAIEADLSRLALTNVPVGCSGGYYYPDWFTLSPTPYVQNYTSLGATTEYNSVYYQLAEFSGALNYLLEPQIFRQQDWNSELEFTELVNVEIAASGENQWIASWVDEAEAGDVGSFVASLGDFSRPIQVTRAADSTWYTQAVWVADVPGSLRDFINTSTLAAASASNKTAYVYGSAAYSQTNFIRATNCWASGFDLTSASPWNSYRYNYVLDGTTYVGNALGNYYPGTAVTPQHILGAAHWFAPTGTVFRFIDATNGIHDRTMLARRFLPMDVAVGLLDSPLGPEISPAKVFASDDVKYIRGKAGMIGGPGIYLVALDALDRAWISATKSLEIASTSWSDAWFFCGGATNLPFSRLSAVGGDSGNPVFMGIGTNTVLLSCYTTAMSGAFYPDRRADIEAAMAAMGGSVYTNLPAPDLSAWTNYDTGIGVPDF